MDPAKKDDYLKLLVELVPKSGENIGNVTLRSQLQAQVAKHGDTLSEEEYWQLRDSLIDAGEIEPGRGRGGSVHRLSHGPSAVVAPEPAPAIAGEGDLYEPFHKAVSSGYTKVNRIKRFASETTARQGRRSTGGRWTRPDLTLIAVPTFEFALPRKRIEVITFEVKLDLENALEGIYEALAHTAFAHRSYLAVKVREYKDDEEIPDERIVNECTRHGVGYITFTDVADYDTYDIVCPAKLREPDPENVDNFIKTQISQPKQDELREHLR